MRLHRPEFRATSEALAPTVVGLFARGRAALALATRLLSAPEAEWAALRGVATQSNDANQRVIAILGEAAALPWVDGLTYLRRGADPRLLLPSNTAVDVPETALIAALLRAHQDWTPPLVVVSGLVVSVASARPLTRQRLTAWVEGRP